MRILGPDFTASQSACQDEFTKNEERQDSDVSSCRLMRMKILSTDYLRDHSEAAESFHQLVAANLV